METPLLAIEGLRKSFGAVDVLKGIDLDVTRGMVLGLIGASGSGKSTLLRCINHLEVPTGGTIRLNGVPVGQRRKGLFAGFLPDGTLSRQRQDMAMVFQNFNLWPHRTAIENVTEGLTVVRKVPRAEALEKGRHLLEKVGLADRQDYYPSMLSGGQQQRVAIARAMAQEPALILFDEPTSALDPELVGEVLKVMEQLAADGMTMIVVTHEMAFARDVCSRVCYLEKGLIADDGPPARIFDPANDRTRLFLKRFHGVPSEGAD